KGVSARQQLSVQQQNGIWTLVQSEEAEIQPRSDEKRILSNVAVLEGAPPLSEHWQLFNNNEGLFNEARTAQAATVVFSLQQNAQIEPLARSIHTLRRQRGSAM
ncbi:BcsE family c-di-GMP-binding protein, partial [Escherichia coli]|uniref:BcsE family c-di-GMP-binding protein n=1 Tax=Escherichia coli TaxID=562 RepID=UPI0021CA645F